MYLYKRIYVQTYIFTCLKIDYNIYYVGIYIKILKT